jgi:hypothetical protein
MTEPIDPIRPVNGDRRARVRRKADAPDKTSDPRPVLTAHLIAQENQRRGLRGGPETLAKAQAAYLTAEWSGPTDRRMRTGIISKTKI